MAAAAVALADEIVSIVEAVVAMIANLKAQGSLTDAQILASAQKAAAGNDALYQTILARIAVLPPAKT